MQIVTLELLHAVAHPLQLQYCNLVHQVLPPLLQPLHICVGVYNLQPCELQAPHFMAGRRVTCISTPRLLAVLSASSSAASSAKHIIS